MPNIILYQINKSTINQILFLNKLLDVVDETTTNEIEKILQIRHLYSHRNGIIDEKFLKYFKGQFQVHSEHSMAICEVCDKLIFLANCVNLIDTKAVVKYGLSVVTAK